MTTPHRISIGDASERIALARWGEDGSRKPPALLLLLLDALKAFASSAD